ncbi:MAG: hypothetical protein WBX11_01390 [Thiobacillaceae bacterium]
MLSPELALQKYQTFDYRIRYLADGVHPLEEPEADTVFALENGIGHGLVCDALLRPLLFETEAEAFSVRKRLGLVYPVLVFHDGEPDVRDAEMKAPGCLDASTLAEVDAYMGERA